MAATQMNTRIDTALKSSGDAVLERYGFTTSQVVRALWEYMAKNQTVPDFMLSDGRGGEHELQAQAKSRAAESAGLAIAKAKNVGIFRELDDMSYEDLREAAFEEQLLESKGE